MPLNWRAVKNAVVGMTCFQDKVCWIHTMYIVDTVGIDAAAVGKDMVNHFAVQNCFLRNHSWSHDWVDHSLNDWVDYSGFDHYVPGIHESVLVVVLEVVPEVVPGVGHEEDLEEVLEEDLEEVPVLGIVLEVVPVVPDDCEQLQTPEVASARVCSRPDWSVRTLEGAETPKFFWSPGHS